MVFGGGNNRNEEEDDLYDQVSSMADRMGLQGEKRALYIDDHMMQGGYQRVQSRESYAKVQQEEGDQGSSHRWFGGGGQQQGGSRRSSGGRGDDSDRF